MNSNPEGPLVIGDWASGQVAFFCPGCNEPHALSIGNCIGPSWGFNGSYSKPTFTPSVLVRGVYRLTDEEHATLMSGGHVDPRPKVCHSFVTDGRIQFLNDCNHDLAGQTVDLPGYQESYDKW